MSELVVYIILTVVALIMVGTSKESTGYFSMPDNVGLLGLLMLVIIAGSLLIKGVAWIFSHINIGWS